MPKPIRIPVIREDGTIDIPLTGGYVAVIDWEDVWVLHKNWSVSVGADGAPYAISDRVSLHRYLLGLVPKDGKYGDHMNGDTLNNRRSNLRIVDNGVNSRNSKMYKNNTSGFKGVSWHKRDNCFQAFINKKSIGNFRTAGEANEARLQREFELWGIQPRRTAVFDDRVAVNQTAYKPKIKNLKT